MFSAWTLNTAWQLIVSSFSIANIVGAAAVAVAVMMPTLPKWLPLSNLRQWAILVAVIAFGYSAVLTKGYNHGLSVKQSEWKAALAKEAERGEKARDDAERSVRNASPDELRNDGWNRDNWKQRGRK